MKPGHIGRQGKEPEDETPGRRTCRQAHPPSPMDDRHDAAAACRQGRHQIPTDSEV